MAPFLDDPELGHFGAPAGHWACAESDDLRDVLEDKHGLKALPETANGYERDVVLESGAPDVFRDQDFGWQHEPTRGKLTRPLYLKETCGLNPSE